MFTIHEIAHDDLNALTAIYQPPTHDTRIVTVVDVETLDGHTVRVRALDGGYEIEFDADAGLTWAPGAIASVVLDAPDGTELAAAVGGITVNDVTAHPEAATELPALAIHVTVL